MVVLLHVYSNADYQYFFRQRDFEVICSYVMDGIRLLLGDQQGLLWICVSLNSSDFMYLSEFYKKL